MAVATKKRPKATLVKKDVLETAGSFLEALPEKPKERLSLREAMGHMRESIQAALARGYSYQDLAEQLSKQGINISASTLKNYVPTGKRQAANASAKSSSRNATSNGAAPSKSSKETSKSTTGSTARGSKTGTAKSTTTTRATTSTRTKSTTAGSTPPKSTRGRKKTGS